MSNLWGTLYDHYGIPGFSKYKNVLLFVSPRNDKYYHQKYQFFNVYLTKDERWASSYSAIDYNHPFSKDFTIKPERIDFKEELSYSIKNLDQEDRDYYYPKPYYKIKGDKAIAVYGNYIEDLFKLKQQGILKARGIFD